MKQQKMCTKCKKFLQLKNFHKKKAGKFGVDSICKKCILIRANKYRITPQGKINYQKAANKSYQKHKQILHQLKINGCAICGYDKCLTCLEFHHINPKDKKFCIGIGTIGKKDFIIELNKCILLCANCHKEMHQK